MSVPARVVTLIVAFLAVAAGGAFIVVHYFLGGPPVEDFTAGVTPDSGATVNVVMQEDPQNSVSSEPDWVSYFIKSPQTGQWVHTTLFKVPAGSRVNMTILGYDGCTPLRNPVWGQVTGTAGQHHAGRRQAGLVPQLVVGMQRGAHVLDPRHQPERADGLAWADRESVLKLAVHIRPGQGDDVQLQDPAGDRRVLLAVPGARAVAASSTDLAVPCRRSAS